MCKNGDVMSKNSINYSELDNKINKKAYRLSDVKDKIIRVAFDIVRFRDEDNGANLWQIQSADDGDYIVAVYDNKEQAETVKTASATNWEVVQVSGGLQFFYKGDPILKTASSSLGMEASDLSAVAKYLPKKLAEDKKLVALLINQVEKSSKEKILNKYPELA